MHRHRRRTDRRPDRQPPFPLAALRAARPRSMNVSNASAVFQYSTPSTTTPTCPGAGTKSIETDSPWYSARAAYLRPGKRTTSPMGPRLLLQDLAHPGLGQRVGPHAVGEARGLDQVSGLLSVTFRGSLVEVANCK